MSLEVWNPELLVYLVLKFLINLLLILWKPNMSSNLKLYIKKSLLNKYIQLFVTDPSSLVAIIPVLLHLRCLKYYFIFVFTMNKKNWIELNWIL